MSVCNRKRRARAGTPAQRNWAQVDTGSVSRTSMLVGMQERRELTTGIHGMAEGTVSIPYTACLSARNRRGRARADTEIKPEHKHGWQGRWHCIPYMKMLVCMQQERREQTTSINGMADGTVSISYMKMHVCMQQERKSQRRSRRRSNQQTLLLSPSRADSMTEDGGNKSRSESMLDVARGLSASLQNIRR